MKIVFSSSSNELANKFVSLTLNKIHKSEVISAKAERVLFDEISKDNSDAYVIENFSSYAQKAIDFIKRKNPCVPIFVLLIKDYQETNDWVKGADFYIFNPDYKTEVEHIQEAILRGIHSYQTNFSKLQNITSKIREEIEFDEKFKYDPIRRNLRYNGNLIKKMSPKEGGVLEIMASNFGKIVKKEIVMEKVWHKADFYTGRSMDVYVTNLRNLFKEKNIPLTIKNIHNAGLILEHDDN